MEIVIVIFVGDFRELASLRRNFGLVALLWLVKCVVKVEGDFKFGFPKRRSSIP